MKVANVVAGSYWLSGGCLSHYTLVNVTADTNGALIVENEETGAFGAGPDLASALGDFREALVQRREVLESSGPLAPYLTRQLDALRRHLRD